MILLSKIQEELQQQIYANTKLLNQSNNLGLNIYRNNLRAGLLQLLQEIFPVCQRVIGNECFAKLVELYIESYPSRNFDLHLYGDCFAKFCKAYAVDWHMDYLFDLCHLEWVLYTTEFAADNYYNYCQDSKLTSSSPVCLANNLQLLKSDYPIDQIWHENQLDEPNFIDLNSGKCYLAIVRPGLEVKIYSISVNEYKILQLMNDLILPVDKLCDHLLTKDHNLPIIECLPNLLTKGIITRYESVGNS